MTFYDLCSEIWEGSPSTNSIEGEESVFKWIKTIDLFLGVNYPFFVENPERLGLENQN